MKYYSVFIDGEEVNNNKLKKIDAEILAKEYREDGYKNVVIDRALADICDECGLIHTVQEKGGTIQKDKKTIKWGKVEWNIPKELSIKNTHN